ncbi:MAG: hypothetical protein E7311_00630 [Clostridiales bacterium]|nr:hypothetical protein [Clostridiales bacterium]
MKTIEKEIHAFIKKKKEERKELLEQSIKLNEQIRNATSKEEFEKAKERVRQVNSEINKITFIIDNVQKQLKNVDAIKENIKNLETICSDMLSSIFSLLNK